MRRSLETTSFIQMFNIPFPLSNSFCLSKLMANWEAACFSPYRNTYNLHWSSTPNSNMALLNILCGVVSINPLDKAIAAEDRVIKCLRRGWPVILLLEEVSETISLSLSRSGDSIQSCKMVYQSVNCSSKGWLEGRRVFARILTVSFSPVYCYQ